MLETIQEEKESLRRRGQGGFTLIELLIVIVILAILAAIVVFAVGSTTKNAVAASCASDAKTVETGLAAYNAQQGSYPTTLSALTTAVAPGTGPWLRSLPASSHYVIFANSSGNVFVANPPPAAAPVVGGTVTAGTITAVATAGTSVDFDANPAVCAQFS